ncbi:DUF4031 domain-containing protein [Aestuariimicrobium ganziense]|uniref:DUF4031 domain-containing protein n=1 Tax=Aestuariimicrobium ganziense TaxID=2773677 RepID=UPI001F29773E|nr:DUF4031 domain-containing protein [Aestuariimicrobium ganziense]
MILLDRPRWPAHGTLFAHLVSDASLDELHRFAGDLGLHWRAFDHDHYDLPERLWQPAVDAGALPMSSIDLVRRLSAAGLRVRPADKLPTVERVLPHLLESWRGLGLTSDADAVRDDLLERWRQPQRHYHDLRHLQQVLEALSRLQPGPALRPVLLAAWFHDAVYDRAPDDEQRSAALVETSLRGLVGEAEVAEVVRLVHLTISHDPEPTDRAGAMLCDADLAVLAQPPGRYDMYVRDVRTEYDHLDDATWRAGRTAVLDHLLALDPLYRTSAGRDLWEHPARVNLQRERRRWSS